MQVQGKHQTDPVQFPGEKGFASCIELAREDIYRNATRRITPGLSAQFAGFTLKVIELIKGDPAPLGSAGELFKDTGGKQILDPQKYNQYILNPDSESSLKVINNISTKVLIELKEEATGKTCLFTIPVVTIGVGFNEPRPVKKINYRPNYYNKGSNFSLDAVLSQSATQEEKELFLSCFNTTSGFKEEREALNIPPPKTLQKTSTTKMVPPSTGIKNILTVSPVLDNFFSSNTELISQITGMIPSQYHNLIPKNQEELVCACEEISQALYSPVDDVFPEGAKILIKTDNDIIAKLDIRDVCIPHGQEVINSLVKTPEIVQAIYQDILAGITLTEKIPNALIITSIINASIIKNAGLAIFPDVALRQPPEEKLIHLIAVPDSTFAPQNVVPIEGTPVCFHSSSIDNLEKFLGLSQRNYSMSLEVSE